MPRKIFSHILKDTINSYNKYNPDPMSKKKKKS
jgi:hypothetical protein